MVESGYPFWIALAVALFVSFVTDEARAIEDADVARCAAVENSIQRLDCFDRLAHAHKLDKPASKQETKSNWRISTEISKIDDSTNISISADANTPIVGWPSTTYVPTLVVRCKEGETNAYIITGMSGHIDRVEGGTTTITKAVFRIDKEKSFSRELTASTDNRAFFIGNARDFVTKLFHHDDLLFNFIPFNSSPVTTTFTITGLQAASEPLRKHCKWDTSKSGSRKESDFNAVLDNLTQQKTAPAQP